MNIKVSLETELRGYACLCKDGETLILFLQPISGLLPHLNSTTSPFMKLEDIIEEFVIHERIHEITKMRDDKIIDGWHIVLCHLLNPNLKQCNCPIYCFWRDIYD